MSNCLEYFHRKSKKNNVINCICYYFKNFCKDVTKGNCEYAFKFFNMFMFVYLQLSSSTSGVNIIKLFS